MNRTTRPAPLTTPPLKVALSTTVDAFTPEAQDLPLTSPLGKRRLFRHRAWYESTTPSGWLRVKFTPGWITNTPSGRVTVLRETVIRDEPGALDAELTRLQDTYGVHLWLAPITMPHSWPWGNTLWWGENAHARQLRTGRKTTQKTAVAA